MLPPRWQVLGTPVEHPTSVWKVSVIDLGQRSLLISLSRVKTKPKAAVPCLAAPFLPTARVGCTAAAVLGLHRPGCCPLISVFRCRSCQQSRGFGQSDPVSFLTDQARRIAGRSSHQPGSHRACHAVAEGALGRTWKQRDHVPVT